MRFALTALAAGLALAASLPVVGLAQTAAKPGKSGTVTGIDKIHDQMRVGGKVCMAEHDHQGEGSMPTREGAQGAAIRKWQAFTADEYGTAWGSYKLAVAKKQSCAQSGGRWTCSVSARPCRPA